MNARYMAVSLLPLLFSITLVNAQQKYKGKLVSKLGQEQSGEITINLDGSNNELIEITYSEQTKTKGKRKSQQTTSMSMKLNVALIKHITINDTTYYFRDIKYDYNDKYYMNVCVRLLEGTVNCGLFQQGRSTGTSNLSVKLPNSELSKLADLGFMGMMVKPEYGGAGMDTMPHWAGIFLLLANAKLYEVRWKKNNPAIIGTIMLRLSNVLPCGKAGYRNIIPVVCRGADFTLSGLTG